MANEADFLQNLFDDLDASVFDLPPSSPPIAIASTSSQRLPARAGPSFSQDKLPTASLGPKPRPCVPLHARASPASTTTETRPAPELPPPSPFWNDPLSRPIVGTPPPRNAGAMQSGGIKRGVLGGASSGAAKKRVSPAGVQARKHVKIAVEEEKENVSRSADAQQIARDVKGKGKAVAEAEEVDFDALMDGMDWEEDAGWSSSQPNKKEVKVPLGKQYTRCLVDSITVGVQEATRRPKKTLNVTSSTFTGSRSVILCDDWMETPVEAGDTINLVGDFDTTSTPSLTVSRLSGLLILHPDILVSSTKVGDSAHCARKALLQEIIRTVGGSTPSLVYGNMLHELLQACMTEGRWEDEWRESKIDEIVGREVQNLWAMDVQVGKARESMREKSKAFGEFKEVFVGGKQPKPNAFLSDLHSSSASDARLAITETLSVEEDIWSPKYGLKGKIDVSVSGTLVDGGDATRQGIARHEGTLPFEIKTGRTSAGMEHRAQTMLYTLLMSDRYDEAISSGLLFYSQSNQVLCVKAARNEIRGLLIARNEFATYLHRRMTLSVNGWPGSTPSQSVKQEEKVEVKKEAEAEPVDEDEEALWGDEDGTEALSDGDGEAQAAEEEDERQLLPAAIDDERSCKRCYVADACMLFRKAVDGDTEISTDEDAPLQLMYEDKTGFLTETHTTFFKKWEKLISYEEQELVRFKKEIWTMGAEERMQVGRCIANMSIDTSYRPPEDRGAGKIHRYTYRLHHATPLATQATSSQHAARSLLGGSISTNDPIVVSLEQPHVLSISRGFVLEVTAHHIVLGLDHSLVDTPQAARQLPSSTQAGDLVFRIDKDELAAGMGRIRDNLIQLFVAKGDDKRRRLVVDLEAPEFDDSLVASGSTTRRKLIPSHLNEDQERAVEKVLSARDYALIMGFPGTGKTTTIAEILKALAKAGKSVLLTSYTHSAVDNILLKVKDAGLGILRLGNRDKIMPALHHLTLDPENKATSLEQLDHQLMMPQIVATTCLGINEPIFTKRHFDVCIVDEASQVTLPTCLGPLRFANTFVLVGDHKQLPPLVRNQAARKGGLDVSLFKLLADQHPHAVVELAHQYRMNGDIMYLSNKLVYDDKLKIGSPDVAARKLELPRKDALSDEKPWLRELLVPERAVIFVDTDQLPAREQKKGSLIENETEARLVTETADALVRCGVAETDIGVIALYRQQIKLINRKLEHLPNVEVLTADRSQGRDKSCIIMSLTRSNTEGQIGVLLKDWRRINVCLTRAKSKLIVFGSRSTLAAAPLDHLQRFFAAIDAKGWTYTLPKEAGEGSRTPRVQVKREVKEEERVDSSSSPSAPKKMRKGGGALALGGPLSQDVVNSLL